MRCSIGISRETGCGNADSNPHSHRNSECDGNTNRRSHGYADRDSDINREPQRNSDAKPKRHSYGDPFARRDSAVEYLDAASGGIRRSDRDWRIHHFRKCAQESGDPRDWPLSQQFRVDRFPGRSGS